MLDHAVVSHEHVVIWWTGEDWYIKDLASRNGTWLGDRRLEPGTEMRLSEADVIRLGNELEYTLESISPPGAEGFSPLRNTWVHAEDGILALPGPDRPACSIYRGFDGYWMAEVDASSQRVEDLQWVRVEDEVFRVFLPDPGTATVRVAPAPSVENLRLGFRHSIDEEHVEIDVIGPSGKTDTLPNRAHHYLLLLLARARKSDADLAEPDRGWVYQDELIRMLRTDDPGLNLHVFRARKSLGALGVEDAASLIERRSGNRQLRIGVESIIIATL